MTKFGAGHRCSRPRQDTDLPPICKFLRDSSLFLVSVIILLRKTAEIRSDPIKTLKNKSVHPQKCVFSTFAKKRFHRAPVLRGCRGTKLANVKKTHFAKSGKNSYK